MPTSASIDSRVVFKLLQRMPGLTFRSVPANALHSCEFHEDNTPLLPNLRTLELSSFSRASPENAISRRLATWPLTFLALIHIEVDQIKSWIKLLSHLHSQTLHLTFDPKRRHRGDENPDEPDRDAASALAQYLDTAKLRYLRLDMKTLGMILQWADERASHDFLQL